MTDYVEIPSQIKKKMKKIELTVDVMFVNNIPSVISLKKIRNSPLSETCWIVKRLPY